MYINVGPTTGEYSLF